MKVISFCFFSLIKTRRHQVVEQTAFNRTHETGRRSCFMPIADALFTVITTETVFVSHFCSSFYLITFRAVSVKDMLFTDDCLRGFLDSQG